MERNQLAILFGKIKLSASGTVAICAVVIMFFGFLGGHAMGWW